MAFKHPSKICPVCGQIVEPIREGKVFCGLKCQKRFNNQKNKAKIAERTLQARRVDNNSTNLQRLSQLPQFRDGVSRDVLISGGVDLSVPPTEMVMIPATGEQMICYKKACLMLQDENVPTYRIIIRN